MKDLNDPKVLRTFLDRYPNGIFADIARSRIETLEADAARAAAQAKAAPSPTPKALAKQDAPQVAATSPASSLTPININSRWKGEVTPTDSGLWTYWCNVKPLILELTVDHGVISGSVTNGQGAQFSIKGELTRSRIRGKFYASPVYVVSGKVEGDTLSGTFRVTTASGTGSCESKFSAARVVGE